LYPQYLSKTYEVRTKFDPMAVSIDSRLTSMSFYINMSEISHVAYIAYSFVLQYTIENHKCKTLESTIS